MIKRVLDIPKRPKTEVYNNIEDFYRAIYWVIANTKIVRVNALLESDMRWFITKQAKRKNKSKKYNPSLWKFKQKGKPIREFSDEEIIARDASKLAREIGEFSPQNPSKFSNFVVIRSRKEIERVLGFWYLYEKEPHQKVPRVYVRYTTLTEHPKSALQVVDLIQKRIQNIT